MPKCSYCNSTILFGGVRESDLRFCNAKCRQKGALLLVARNLPEDEVLRRVAAVHQGPCPRCQRPAKVDVHTSHTVWSAGVVTVWKSTPQLSCTPCGKKAKFKGALGSLFLGWWGFPWGILMTPVQVTRNIAGLFGAEPEGGPSPQLERIVRINLATEVRKAELARLPQRLA